MKKLIALTLVIVMCLSLAACGGKVNLLGKWKTDDGKYVMTLEKDGKGKMVMGNEEGPITWEFNSKANTIIVTYNGYPEDGTYMEDSDTLYIDGLKFVRVK